MRTQLFLYVSQWNAILGQPGMTLYTFDPETGEMALVRQLNDSLSLGCSLVDPEKQVLYVCNECDRFPETPMNTGRIYCFQIDPRTGDLRELNHAETYCSFTSYVNMDPTGKYLIASNHSWPNFITNLERDENGRILPVVRHSDSVVNLFAVNDDGSIGEMLDFHRHPTDGSVHLSLLGRPHIPHPHCMMRSPSGNLFACCDKGDGHVYLYRIREGKLALLSRTLVDDPRSEPRYCAFHPTMPYLYVNLEHTPADRLTMAVLRYTEDGSAELAQTLYMDVGDYMPKEPHRQQQGMCITPDGRFVYTQAHGYNLILTLAVDAQTGLLRQIGAAPVRGTWPRSLTMSPDGRFLICTCLGGEITVYQVGEDGSLTDTGHGAMCPGAGYVSFFQP